ncbi:1-phosphofructokinase [Clostridium oryzae]|uniref:Tagatose-6-phosphate kinase n=1 Tax=Clostridium oryzae TaxID=1450648 RepID=A0A1V4IDH0_9CLOT|nr:1-phosphofructokinase [Clostridium oryzae]OPJ57986.1 tagatose-6-phosphate kinase [Clostridium oryzae]
MIYTVTLNPALDYIVELHTLNAGEVNRVNNDHKYPGGKGINVSRVLNNLKVPSIATGFIGGFIGDYIEAFLKEEGVNTDFIKVSGDTRINVKVKCSDEETEINGAGPKIDNQDLNKLFSKLEQLNSEDFLVLSGNVQKTLSQDIYAIIMSKCTKNGVKVIVDTTGKSLIDTLKYKPFLIKPNNHELGDIFNVKITSQEEVITYGKKLVDMGSENIIISLAEKGSILITAKGIYKATAPKGIVKNSVGAGDSLIGGLLAKYSQGIDIVESFRWATATGSATAFSVDLCKEDYVLQLLPQVKISEIY